MQTPHDLSTLAEEYLLKFASENYSVGTRRTYASILQTWLLWFHQQEGRFPHTLEFDEALLRRFLAASRLAPKSLSLYRSVLSGFAAWLAERSYTPGNVAAGIGPIRLPKRLPQALTDGDIAAVELYLKDRPAHLTLFRLLLDTGLRREEVATLRREHVHLEDGRGRPLTKGWLQIVGKGDKERRVGVGRIVAGELRHYLRHLRPTAGSETDDAFLFLNRLGRHYQPHTITELFGEWERAIGLTPRLHPHACRHTFATRWIAAGGDVAELSYILGHSTIAQTMQYVRFEQLNRAVERHQSLSPIDRRDEEARGKTKSAPGPFRRVRQLAHA